MTTRKEEEAEKNKRQREAAEQTKHKGVSPPDQTVPGRESVPGVVTSQTLNPLTKEVDPNFTSQQINLGGDVVVPPTGDEATVTIGAVAGSDVTGRPTGIPQRMDDATDGWIAVVLNQDVIINGVTFRAGPASVPADAFEVWKNAVDEVPTVPIKKAVVSPKPLTPEEADKK